MKSICPEVPVIQTYRNVGRLVCLGWLLVLLCCGFVAAQESSKTSGQTFAPADTGKSVATAAASAPLVIFNRTVTEFHSSLFGVSPTDRAERAKGEIVRVLLKGGAGKVTQENTSSGKVILLDGEHVFMLLHQDANLLEHESIEQAAHNAVQVLTQVVAETREARDLSALLRAAGLAALATIILLLLVWILRQVRGWVAARILPLAQQKSSQLRVGGEVILRGELVLGIVSRVMTLCYWLGILLLFYQWLGYVLARFPYTRPLGERLMQYLLKVAGNIANGMLHTIPNLLIAFVIFLLAKGLISLLSSFFDRVEGGQISLSWLDRDTVRPTRRLISAAIWLFALAMAYPYLPGAQTEAFKGLSVLVGLMISLGASSLVGQAASGLILMYTRTMRPGEFVGISDKEGTVVELGLFTTRIRTGTGEELTLPNSLILGTVTKNYSRTVQGHGFILGTTVTIGYDTPWRQIHAMLIEAARRTDGVLLDPPPRVFQLALSDYYPEYRLVCQAVPSTPLPRAEILTALHANIQDVFNEYGVQIMSPHYMADPAEAKVVAKKDWYAAPSTQPDNWEQ